MRGLSVWALILATTAFVVALVLGILGTIAFGRRPVPAGAAILFSAQPINWEFLYAPAPNTYLLPFNPESPPQPITLADPTYYWILPAPGVLYRIHVAGDATLFGSANTVVDSNSTALAVSLDLWVNGSFAKRLVTVPPGTSTFDVIASPMFSVGVYDRYQYVFNLTQTDGTGSIGGFVVTPSWLPLSR